MRNLSTLRALGMSNKWEGGGGGLGLEKLGGGRRGGGGKGGKKTKSLMSGALFKNLLKPFFLRISTSFIKEPITGFYASKCFTSLNKSSFGFLFLIMFSQIGSSLLLKLASFSLLLVTCRSSSPCISSPKSLVANRNSVTSSLKGLLTSFCWKSLPWEKLIPSKKSL